jgi:hypothetical protein
MQICTEGMGRNSFLCAHSVGVQSKEQERHQSLFGMMDFGIFISQGTSMSQFEDQAYSNSSHDLLGCDIMW